MTECRIIDCHEECFTYSPVVLCKRCYREYQKEEKEDQEMAIQNILSRVSPLTDTYDIKFMSVYYPQGEACFDIGIGESDWEESEADVANILNEAGMKFNVVAEAQFEFTGQCPFEIHKKNGFSRF